MQLSFFIYQCLQEIKKLKEQQRLTKIDVTGMKSEIEKLKSDRDVVSTVVYIQDTEYLNGTVDYKNKLMKIC